ncbi:Ig-like domain-containing protein [Pseudomonas sp. SA3-5]|uniref:Ig-like domain-containing protein n=1 Tax=Pseudomonas aestuarii TaxID=3018340 RepID=A0ABT4XFD7_9PSED|nr:Ig-like domain-containing protein [Pseudomonas aestuarii]MDA7086946.1 Ig-like domain-containing protein [Pseudomonas aestuarii]
MRVSKPYATSMLCILALSAGLTFAAEPNTPAASRPVQEAREAAAAHTTDVLGLNKRLQTAAASERSQLREQLVSKAEQRRQLLAELAQSNPAEVLRVAIPDDKQKGMPAEVVAKLEQRVELDGELQVIYEDYENGDHKLRHFLKTPFGERFELRLAGAKREWRSGLSVRAQGVLLEKANGVNGPIQGDLVVNDDDSGLLLLADGATTSTTGELAYDLPNATGAQRTLAILVNFQDKPSDKPWTTSQANSLVFGDVSNFFKENSSQQTWLSGDVAGWYTIPVNSTVCDGFAIEQNAKAAAQSAGYNLGNYERFLFIFPQNSACGYSGMGQVGATPSSAWIHNNLNLRTVGHEMGHNLGLYHAHALDCGDTTLGSSCTSQEYGDTLDIMGYSGTVGHFNGFSKERLGWLASSNIINVSSAGNFTLKPSSAQTTGGKLLKIANGVDSSGAPRYYYVEYRQPQGFDAKITDRGVVDANNVFNGVAVHQASPSNGNSSQLLDMTAGSNFVDMKDAALTGGRSFSDSGMTLTTQSTDASQALVTVDFGGGGGSTPTCTRSAPSVSVSPGQSTWLAAGGSFSYTVSVTNKDSSACSSSSFSLSPSKPSGWSTSLGSTSLSLAPGASASTTLKVTSPSSAVDGFYSVGSSATANGLGASGSASFVIDNPTSVSNHAPTAVNDTPSLSSVTSINVPVLANDSDLDGDKLNIVAFTQGSKGSVSLNSDGSLRYSPANSFKSSDQFSYTISDGKSSASATVSISLQSSTGSTGGKGNGKGKP